MTSIRDTFTISLYLTVGLAALMLGLAEGGWLLPTLLTLPVAAAAHVLVERNGGGISTLTANVLGIVAIAAAFGELMLRDVEGRILFGAHLLVYLTWIVLAQPKRSQQHWSLIALAVLEIAVGSLLTNSGVYGVAMVVFVVLTVWTLVLMQLCEATAGLDAEATPPPANEPGPRQLLAAGHVAPTVATAHGLWRPRQILAVVNVTVVASMAVGGLFFLLIPRLEVGRRAFNETDAPLARQRVTGFNERVRLGAFGEILESSVPVFEVRIFDDDAPIGVEAYASEIGLDEPLFRGLVLADYDHGEWAMEDSGYPSRLPAWPFADQIRQEYRMKTDATDVLFAIAPVYAGHVVGDESPILHRPGTGTIFRPDNDEQQRELQYDVYSPRDPAIAEMLRESTSRSYRGAYDRYLDLPDDLEAVRRYAAEVARPDGNEASETDRARRLTSWLRESGTFRYSLSGELIDPSLDPVEDFLINRRAGHCEYFASTLALLLRADGIPARVVSGFKGGEINRLNGTYVVQQRHAHAWVEARIEDRWVTLDPTPASQRSESVAANAPSLPLWSDFRSAVSNLWYQYVLKLDMSRQRQVLQPLRQLAVSTARQIRQHWWPALKSQVYVLATDPSRWFSWQGGVATFVGLSLVVVLWRVGRRLKLMLSRLRAARDAHERRGRRVEFYERFRRLCEQFGWKADIGQTPREFAADIAATLGRRTLPPSSQSLPAELTDDYYGVRFGNIELSDARHRELSRRLAELEADLAAFPRAATADNNNRSQPISTAAAGHRADSER